MGRSVEASTYAAVWTGRYAAAADDKFSSPPVTSGCVPVQDGVLQCLCFGLSDLINISVCSCVCVRGGSLWFLQGVCQGERAGGEEAGVPEAPQTAADRERVNRVPEVDLQSWSETSTHKTF